MTSFVDIFSTSWLINSDYCIDIWASCETFWKWYLMAILTQIPILIFWVVCQNFPILWKYWSLPTIGNFPISPFGKGLLSKHKHAFGDALAQSPENVFLVEVRSCWKRFPSLLRELLPNGLFDFHGGWYLWDDWDNDLDWLLLNLDVVNDTNRIPFPFCNERIFWKGFLWLFFYSYDSSDILLCICTSDILPWTLSLP